MPGRIGAISTDGRSPAAASREIASSRLLGDAAPGSVIRATASSSVPIDIATLTRVRPAASLSRSMSRTISDDLVRIENGLRRRDSTSTSPRVSR